MRLINTTTYHQEIDRIYACCMNPDFVKAKMTALGARNIEVTIQKKGDTTTVKIIREIPVEVPSTLKSLIQPWSKMTQTEIWKGTVGGPYDCNITIDLQGVPLSIQSQMKLATNDTETVAASITEVNCRIPFIGKALTHFIGETSKKAIEQEFAYMAKHV
jgi:hypothetical protein